MAGSRSKIEKKWRGYTYHTDRYGYVFGGQGELYTRELAEDWAVTRHGGKDIEYFLEDAKHWYAPPRKVVDCSGMIVEAFRAYEDTYGDRTANTFKSRFVNGGTIDTLPEDIAGLGVWKRGHIGVYLGNGRVVEAKGVNHGVEIGNTTTTKWTHWGYIEDVDYLENTPEPKPPRPKLKRYLRYVWYNRMRGEDVKQVQEVLQREGFNLGRFGKNRDGIDGIYGKVTYGAVWQYQKKHGLRIDGIVGPQTWGHMFD